MTSVGEAIRDFQIRCLLGAQDNLKKARSGGFDLPAEVAVEVQTIMEKIPTLIRRLEYRPELAGTTTASLARENGKDSGGHDRG